MPEGGGRGLTAPLTGFPPAGFAPLGRGAIASAAVGVAAGAAEGAAVEGAVTVAVGAAGADSGFPGTSAACDVAAGLADAPDGSIAAGGRPCVRYASPAPATTASPAAIAMIRPVRGFSAARVTTLTLPAVGSGVPASRELVTGRPVTAEAAISTVPSSIVLPPSSALAGARELGG